MDSGHLQDLQDNGFTVVQSVLTEQEVNYFAGCLWQYLESKYNITQDPLDWKRSLSPDYAYGVLNHSIGHENFMWQARTHNNVMAIFAKIWNIAEEDLLVSFDGCNVAVPRLPEEARPAWPHVDQTKPGFGCVQGFLALTDSEAELAGGTYVIPKSHKKHDFLFSANGEFYGTASRTKMFSSEEVAKFFSDSPAIKVRCKKGDFVLWDSRLVHWGQEPIIPQGIRLGLYICMTPRSFASPEELEKKRKAFLSGAMTAHLPHEIYEVTSYFPEVTQLPKFTQKPLEKQYFTKTILRLAGFEGENI